MQKTEENIFLLLKIVEDFNNKCTFYKSKNKTNSMCSNTVSTKDSSNEDDRKEFLETFNDFIRKLNNLHHHLLEDNDMNETYQNVDKTYNTNKNINCIDRSDTENCMEGNLNSDENMKERCKGKMKENEKISEEKEKNVCIDKKKTKLLNNFYNNDLSKSNRNINLQIYKEFHHTDSKSEYSLTDTNTSIENEDIINKRNDILIKYVIDLDYALNVKRISKENLIEEIKEFYTIHNNNIRLNNYSMYLSVEVINILKKKIDKDNFHFINKHENPFKNNKFFFNVPSNYLFIKNYSEQNKEILYASNNTNYEKSLNGISTYALSYNSSSVNGNSCNLCANSILSRNNSYNKYNSPNFGFLERQFSPNFGSFDENNNSENFNNKDENEFHKSSDYEEDKCNIYFNYNSHKEPTDKVLSKCSTALSSKNMNIYNSPDYSSNYNNEEELTNNLNDKTELDNDQLYEINNIENKKNNLSSNTSDFYQSISNFYKNKENYNCGEIDHTYIQKSSLFTNSNETDININNKSFHENKKNLINLCFDDELSSAITLNNDSSLNKDKSSCYLSEKGNYISDYKTDSNNKYIYEEENKLHMEKLMEYEQDENRWYDEYCNGDPSLFRSKQLKKKKEIMLHYLSSLSDNNSIKENLKKSTKYEIGNINPNKDDRNFNSGNNYDNMYNVINLKVMYENNKSEFCTNEEIIFFPNQIIVNKYQVLKIISKTKFSTTLKCLNLHYKKKKNNKKMHSIKNNENDEEPIYRNIDENWNKNICNPLNCLKSERKTVSSNEYNKKKNYDSENVQRSNNNSNNNNRKKDYKYVCLKVMNNGKSFLDQGLFELIVLNMLCNENNNVNDNSNNKLTNKNIIQLYDYFYFKEHLIIVTEYMQSDLYNYFIKKGKIGTIGQLQVLAKNLLEGLEFIHSKNLIHCDLKPENIMISMKKRDYGKRQKKKNGNKSINEEVVNCYNLKNLKTLNITKNDFLEHDSHIDNANQDEFISSLHKNNEDNMDNFSINNYTEHNKLKNNLDIPHMYSKKANNDLFSCGENSTNSEDLQIFSGEKFDKIKIIDFNSAIYESDKLKMYVQTRSYRSPEVLLQQNYDRKIDIWSLGCILFEFLTKKILFDHQNIYRFIYSIVSYIGHLPFYMIYECKIPYIFTKHGLIILKKIILDKNFENCVKEKPIDEMDDQEVIFNSKDFFRLNKKMDLEDELIQTKQQNTDASSKQRSQEVYYDVCYPNNNLLKNNFHIGDLLFIDFLLSLLQIDPCKRLDSTQALKHPWLTPNLYKDGL